MVRRGLEPGLGDLAKFKLDEQETSLSKSLIHQRISNDPPLLITAAKSEMAGSWRARHIPPSSATQGRYRTATVSSKDRGV